MSDGDLPSTEQLAVIVAATDRNLPFKERFQEALTLWRETSLYLRNERHKIEAAKHLSALEIQQSNDENARRAAEAMARDKDPFGLGQLADSGVIATYRFLRAVLPDNLPLPDQFGEPKDPNEPLVRKERRLRWRPSQRDKALREFLCASFRDFSQGTDENPVFVPRFADGEVLLESFASQGLPIDWAIGLAEEFRTFSVMMRELNRDSGRWKGGDSTKEKHAATKRARDPNRKPTKWERETKRAKKR